MQTHKNTKKTIFYIFLGGYNVLARDLWEKDKIKKELAENNGYKIIYIWECEFNKMSKKEILKIINNELSKN